MLWVASNCLTLCVFQLGEAHPVQAFLITVWVGGFAIWPVAGLLLAWDCLGIVYQKCCTMYTILLRSYIFTELIILFEELPTFSVISHIFTGSATFYGISYIFEKTKNTKLIDLIKSNIYIYIYIYQLFLIHVNRKSITK